MQSLKTHIIFRYFWVFMALHILNCSIDTPDAQPDCIPENLSINDIESISELILEDVFGIDNAIAERDEHDTDNHQDGTDITKIQLFCQSSVTLCFTESIDCSFFPVVHITCKEDFYLQFQPEIVSPPPQVA